MIPNTLLGTIYDTLFKKRCDQEKEETKILVRQMKTPFKLDFVRSLFNIHGV